MLTWAFPASTSTVPRARRLVAQAVTDHGLGGDVCEQVALVVGELAANAVMHARTPYTVALHLEGPRLRVEVGDGSPGGVVPVAQPSGMTGRGMLLVDAVSRAWGVRPHHGGKTVWVELDATGPGPSDDPRPRTHRVTLLGTPVGLWVRSITYHDDLLREASLVADGIAQGTVAPEALPEDLVRLARALTGTYSSTRGQDEGRASAALAAGREVLDVELVVPGDVAAELTRLQRLFDEASQWTTASEYLLTPPPDPEVERFRRWYLEEVVEQVRGRPPRPWAASSKGDPGHAVLDLRDRDQARSQRRLRLLAQVAGLLDAPLDLRVMLQQIAQLAIEELADWCAVDLESLDPEQPEGRPDGGPASEATAGPPTLVAVAHKDPDMVALALELQERYPPAEHDPERERLLRELAPQHLPVVTDEMLVAGARDEQHLAILRSLGMSSAVAVPLQASGTGFGVMLLVATDGRQLDEDDVELAVELGRRAGTAVHKARLAEQVNRTATELALSEARYRTLVQASSMAVWRASADGTTLTDMPAWRAVTGSETTRGWSWLDDVHPQERDRVRQAWLRCVEDGTPYEQTYRIRANGGGWRWVSARAVPVRPVGGDAAADGQGPVLEWVGSVSDVTTHVLAQQRTEMLLACAQSLARAVDVPAVLASLRDVAAAFLGAEAVVVALPAAHRFSTAAPLVRHAAAEGESRAVGPAASLVLVRTDDEIGAYPLLAETVRTGRARLPERAIEQAALPLLYDGQLVAAVQFSWAQPQDVDPSFGLALQAAAAQYAAALVRAELYDAERATSLALQSALAPDVPRRLGGVSVGVHYRPAGVHAQVGGDWADVIRLRDGRVLLALGDVMGSGIPAAATMGRLRTTLAALALHEDDPARLLHDLDRFLHVTPGDQLATLALAVIDDDGRCATLHSAGHLPALLSVPGAPARLLDADRTPPLGVGWSLRSTAPAGLRVDLPDGAVLALFSDGLLETRDSHIDHRLAVLQDLLTQRPPTADLDAVAVALVDAVQPSADDDVTLLLARADVTADGDPANEKSDLARITFAKS